MKKARLPLPVLILMSSVLFLFSTSFGEWIARPSAAVPTPARGVSEEQQAAITFVRAMSWLSQLMSHPNSPTESSPEAGRASDHTQPRTAVVTVHRIQLCYLSKPSRPPRSLCRSLRWQFSTPTSPRRVARLIDEQRTTEN